MRHGTWLMYHVYHTVMHWFMRLDHQEWLIVLVIGMVAGFVCMRGFGTRARM